MKAWFAKLKISLSLDSRRPLPPALRQEIDRSEELRRFAEASACLDRALKDSSPNLETPHSLHNSIMRAVREAQRPLAVRHRWAVRRWLPAPVLALGVVLGAWWLMHRPTAPRAQPVSLAAAASALDLSEQITQTMPVEVVAPLSDEWDRLNRDVTNTAEFLLASLP
jgi:hypothetical protein